MMRGSIIYSGLVVLAFLAGCDNEVAEPSSATKTFMKYYGAQYKEEGFDLEQTADNGYLIVGATTSANPGTERDILIVKTDIAGNAQWVRTIGEEGDDVARRVRKTPDGGYLIVGDYTEIQNGNPDKNIILIKMTETGEEVWRQTYGYEEDTVKSQDQGMDVVINSDGRYLIIGHSTTQSEGWQVTFIQTDQNGELLDDISLIGQGNQNGQAANDYANAILPDEIGKNLAYFLGHTNYGENPGQEGNINIFVGTIDDDGDSPFPNIIGQEADEYGVQLTYSHDNKLLLLCNRQTQNQRSGIFLLKLNHNLLQPEYIEFPELSGLNLAGQSICKADDGYIILANQRITGLDSNIVLIKIDFDGNLMWKDEFKSFGGEFNDSGNSLILDNDQRIVLAGKMAFSALENHVKMCLIKTNGQGELEP